MCSVVGHVIRQAEDNDGNGGLSTHPISRGPRSTRPGSGLRREKAALASAFAVAFAAAFAAAYAAASASSAHDVKSPSRCE